MFEALSSLKILSSTSLQWMNAFFSNIHVCLSQYLVLSHYVDWECSSSSTCHIISTWSFTDSFAFRWMSSSKRSLYPDEFTWWFNDERSAKRKKLIANMNRTRVFNHRQWVKIDDEILITNVEMKTLAVAQERHLFLISNTNFV